MNDDALAQLVFSPPSRTDEVRAALIAALSDLPADLSARALAAHIRTAIPFGVELANTTCLAVAEGLATQPATERVGRLTPDAIAELTQPWQSVPWRLISETPLSASLNLAFEEVISNRVADGTAPPTLRFWQWAETAIVLGRSQSATNEVDIAEAARANVRILRRTSGGGAMFVQPHATITYSLCLPETLLQGLTIRRSYEVCDAWVVLALRELGIDAHHVPVNDIACEDGKIAGAAQSRRRGVVIHHTTIAYDMDANEMASLLRIGTNRKGNTVRSAAKRVSPLTRQTVLSRAAIARHLLESFAMRYGGTCGTFTDDERADAAKLAMEKYDRPEWNTPEEPT